MSNTELLKNVWASIYDPHKNVSEIIENFFHVDYEQCINGAVMNRTQYIHHVIEQRKNMTIDSIDYKYIIEKDNALFALYYPKGRGKNNLPLEAEVIAYFCFSKHQIVKIHGQVHIIQGNYADVDMK